MKRVAFILFLLGVLVWFLAGLSVNQKPVINIIYGERWQAIAFWVAVVAFLVWVKSLWRKKLKF